MSLHTLTEDHKDILKELVNIAYGATASALSILLDSFATMHIPQITILETPQLNHYIKEHSISSENCYVAKQLFYGRLEGEALFIVDNESGANLAHHLGNSGHINDAILEAATVICTVMVKKLAEQFGGESHFGCPEIALRKSNELLDGEQIENFSEVIIIDTLITFEKEDIIGKILILTKEDNNHLILDTLNTIIEEQFS